VRKKKKNVFVTTQQMVFVKPPWLTQG